MARKPQSESVARPVARKRATGKARSAPAKASRDPRAKGTTKARKPTPLKDLSPDYAKRLRAAAKREGITVSQLRKRGVGAARGHKPPPSGLTESQQKRLRRDAKIEAFVQQQIARFPAGRGDDPEATAAAMLAGLKRNIRERGMGWFNDLLAEIARMNRQYMAGTRRDKRGRRVGLGYDLATLGELYDLPPETYGYH